MKFKNLTLLSEGQIWGADSECQLDVFKKCGTQIEVTDLCILRGIRLPYGSEDDNHHDCGIYYAKNGRYWTKSSSDGKVCIGDEKGQKVVDVGYRRDCAIRPILQSPEIFAHVSPNRVKGEYGVYEVDFGEYPQTAPDEMQPILESEYKGRRNLIITGKTYTFDCCKYDDYHLKFKPETFIEYEYQGKKYIRVYANPSLSSRGFVLSNNYVYEDNNAIWVEVLPVRWLIDDKAKLLIAKKGLLSGVKFHKRKRNDSSAYEGDFNKTEMCTFLNDVMFQDLTQKEIKHANFNKNPYNLICQAVSDEQIIKWLIKNDVAIFLHGCSSLGKFESLKKIDSDCEMIYLPNTTLESLNGKSILDKSRCEVTNLKPTWFEKLQKKCEGEPDRLHLVLIDEITNASTTMQGTVFNIILNKEINELWKLPKNARIVLGSNDMEDSIVSNKLTELYFNKFIHFHIQTPLKDLLKWSVENNIHHMICSYIAYRGDKALFGDNSRKDSTVNPKKWEMASKMLYVSKNPSSLMALVGEEIATDFIAFCYQQTITLDNVINRDYTDEHIQQLNSAQKYAITAGLVRVDENYYRKVREFVIKLGTQYLEVFDALWLQDSNNKQKEIEENNTDKVLTRNLKK